MTDWFSMAIVVVIFVLFCMYSYSLLQLFLTIRKCPDCGRIMQKVKYEDLMEQEHFTIVCECPFCQSKHIHPSHPGKKLTLHP